MNALMPLPDTDRPKGAQRPLLRPPKTRIPVTITIDPEKYAFAEKSVREGACSSMDEFFEFATSVLEKLNRERRRFIVGQMLTGRSHKQIMRVLDGDLIQRLRAEELKDKRQRRKRKIPRKKAKWNIGAKSAD